MLYYYITRKRFLKQFSQILLGIKSMLRSILSKNERSSRMPKEEKRRKFSEESSDPFYDVMKTASTTECTGLVPSGILDESESEAYGELYAIHPPKAPEDGEENFIR